MHEWMKTILYCFPNLSVKTQFWIFIPSQMLLYKMWSTKNMTRCEQELDLRSWSQIKHLILTAEGLNTVQKGIKDIKQEVKYVKIYYVCQALCAWSIFHIAMSVWLLCRRGEKNTQPNNASEVDLWHIMISSDVNSSYDIFPDLSSTV